MKPAPPGDAKRIGAAPELLTRESYLRIRVTRVMAGGNVAVWEMIKERLIGKTRDNSPENSCAEPSRMIGRMDPTPGAFMMILVKANAEDRRAVDATRAMI